MMVFTLVCCTASSIASTIGSSKLMLPHFTGSKLSAGTVFNQSCTSDKGLDLQRTFISSYVHALLEKFL